MNFNDRDVVEELEGVIAELEEQCGILKDENETLKSELIRLQERQDEERL